MTRKKNKAGDLRPSFLLLLVAALAVGLLIFFWSIKRPFCANSKSCVSDYELDTNAVAVFNGQKISAPAVDINLKPNKVLGEETMAGEKHIYVDLATQTLKAFQGDELYMEAPVSTGKWFATPTGDFTIWMKIKSTRMSGGEGADYYDLPNVPYTMFFYGSGISQGQGFGLHGAYWHNNFGHPMSHGCVNMRTVDAKKLFEWVMPNGTGTTAMAGTDNPGTKLTIYGKAPI